MCRFSKHALEYNENLIRLAIWDPVGTHFNYKTKYFWTFLTYGFCTISTLAYTWFTFWVFHVKTYIIYIGSYGVGPKPKHKNRRTLYWGPVGLTCGRMQEAEIGKQKIERQKNNNSKTTDQNNKWRRRRRRRRRRKKKEEQGDEEEEGEGGGGRNNNNNNNKKKKKKE